MSKMLLAKPKLDADYIDCSVGEAYSVREALLSVFDVSACDLPNPQHLFEYQNPQGYQPLVQLLEDKYQHPVVITNGAKQGLAATMYCLQQMGKSELYLPDPFWALLPPLMEQHGLNHCLDYGKMDSYLCVAPDNPDGTILDIKAEAEQAKECNIPFIHDAAYYTHTYLPATYPLGVHGDAQIYSASKAYGLSGLRIGWVVCKNPQFYQLVCQYMEMMTVGVSVVSQVFLHDLLTRMNGYPTLTEKFEQRSFDALQTSKRIVKQIHPDILQVPDNIEQTAGMFLWAKVGPKADFERAKVNVVSGEHFGEPGYVRMNLAFAEDKMQEIVNRLNSVIE